MQKKKSSEGLTAKKEKNFSKWYTQILDKAEIVDLRLGIKGFVVIRPWGTLTIEKIYDLYEEELQKKGQKPTIMPSVISESNLKKESSHIEGFTPEVFWLQTEKGEEKLALRPTSETLYTPMFALWVRSHRDLPLKLYQRGSVFRYDTKATRPLIRGREFYWIETHNAFATKKDAEAQVLLEESQQELSSLKASIGEDFSGIYYDAVDSVVIVSTNTGKGTGFIIDREGYIVTNYHIMEGATAAGIYTSSDGPYDVQLIGV
ncbi:unnamed protein product, partial [marine sediment metagenome]